jgi:hypothetical protein
MGLPYCLSVSPPTRSQTTNAILTPLSTSDDVLQCKTPEQARSSTAHSRSGNLTVRKADSLGRLSHDFRGASKERAVKGALKCVI